MRAEVLESVTRPEAGSAGTAEGPREIPSETARPAANLASVEPAWSAGEVPRSAWIEVDLGRLRGNLRAIRDHARPGLKWLCVVKDGAYGHGAETVARVALAEGASFLGVSTVGEAVALRDAGIAARILVLGDRVPGELSWCVERDLTCCVGEAGLVDELNRVAARVGKRVPVHLKINTGMNRHGVRWPEVGELATRIAGSSALLLEGALSHFAQSDEADKTFARVQISRYEEALREIAGRGLTVSLRHLCNSGGFLDLPEAHFDMVRLGILPLGVYPSSVCRRLPGIEPVMSVKARLVAVQELEAGDTVGYGMRFTATTPRRIAVVPLGYGDGFPRVRNLGYVLVAGRRAPLVGGVAMDAFMVDITDIPEAQLHAEAVVVGRQGAEEITVHDLARWKGSVSYDVLAGWRGRLPRICRP